MTYDAILRNAVRLAATGGALVVLSGSAMAADPSVAPVTSPQAQKPDPAAASTTPDQGGGKGQFLGNRRGSGSAVQPSSGQASGSGEAGQGINNASNSGPSPVTTPDGTAKGAGQPDGVTGGQASGAGKTQLFNTNSSSSNGVSGESATNGQGPRSVEVPLAPQEAQQPALKASSEPPVVRFRSEYLPVQPTIVSHIVTPSDLAATIPSEPSRDKGPEPAKSSGALAALPAMLAGIIVPQTFWLHTGAVLEVFPALLLLVLILILINVFTFTYGLWLRRGGYATAARSDEPQGFHLSYLATPLSLGYVWTLRLRHSPIFVVSESQNSLMAPMLRERRICI